MVHWHEIQPFISVRFHPEAMGGRTDTDVIFNTFLTHIRNGSARITTMPPDIRTRSNMALEKVLLLESGGLSIGRAG